MLTQLENSAKVVGVKQTRRALNDGRARAVYLALDADPGLTEPLSVQAEEKGVAVHWIDSMKALGRACGIAVGAAVAAAI